MFYTGFETKILEHLPFCLCLCHPTPLISHFNNQRCYLYIDHVTTTKSLLCLLTKYNVCYRFKNFGNLLSCGQWRLFKVESKKLCLFWILYFGYENHTRQTCCVIRDMYSPKSLGWVGEGQCPTLFIRCYKIDQIQVYMKQNNFISLLEWWRNICYLPGGRSVWEKTVPEVLSTARGRRPRAVLKTKGTVFFPYGPT